MTTPDPPAAYAHGEAHLFRIGLAPIEDKDWFEGPYGPADGDPASRKAAIFAGDPDLCRQCGYLSYAEIDQVLKLKPSAIGNALKYF